MTGRGMNNEALGIYVAPSDDADEKTYTIGDLAREFGITLRALRFYEGKELISPRREGTARIYSGKDRRRIQMILKAKQLGFTLAEISAMLTEERPGDGSTIGLRLSLNQIEDQISHLERQKAEIEEALAELRARRASYAAAA